MYWNSTPQHNSHLFWYKTAHEPLNVMHIRCCRQICTNGISLRDPQAFRCLYVYIIIKPLIPRVVVAPPMTSQPVFSMFPCHLLPSGHLPNSRPVHSLTLSTHFFLCPPCRVPFTVPCKMVLARPDEKGIWPCDCCLCRFTIVRSLCGPFACWNLTHTSQLVTSSLHL